jgi:hypothetical protein
VFFAEFFPFGTACPKADKQMGMKKLLLEKMLLAFEFHNTVSGATAIGIVPVYVGLDYHSGTSNPKRHLKQGRPPAATLSGMLKSTWRISSWSG